MEETLDRLAGEWWIAQLRRGHRYSTDDVATAFVGTSAAPTARRVVDLCAGVGSVGLLSLLRLGAEASLLALEVQPISASLMRRTVELNHLSDRVEVREIDLRRAGLAPADPRFDLVLANPPYLPEGRGLRSPHPQRAAARMELNGDVFDVCRAAARHVSPTGRFALCFAAADPRPVEALAAAGLRLESRTDLVFREGRAPMVAVYVAGIGDGIRERPATSVCVRDGVGAVTADWNHIRRELRMVA